MKTNTHTQREKDKERNENERKSTSRLVWKLMFISVDGDDDVRSLAVGYYKSATTGGGSWYVHAIGSNTHTQTHTQICMVQYKKQQAKIKEM